MQQVRWSAHVFAYVDTYGDAPEGYVVDHECHNGDLSCSGGRECQHRRCCNPHHLVAKPGSANLDAANAVRKRAQFAEECSKGHPYDEDNTGWLVRKSGPRAGQRQRYCLQCNRDKAAARRR